MSIARFFPALSLKRPVTMVMLFLALTLIGSIAYQQIPVQLFPSGYTPPFLYVRIINPNSTPKETEEQIVRPAEELFATLKGLRKLRSWAGADSGSFWMRFENSVAMTTIYNQVKDRLERLMPTLPSGVERYFIWKWNPEAQPILSFGISMPKVTKDSFHILEQQLFTQIRRLPGVSKMDVSGIEKSQVYVIIDRDKARSHRISIYQLVQKLKKDNFALPSGQLQDGGRLFYLRSQNRIKSIQALKEYPIAKDLKLKDIARVVLAVDPNPHVYRINGVKGLFLDVYKESEANTIEISRKLRKLLDHSFSQRSDLKDFKVNLFVDQGKMIQSAIQQLQQSALWGGFFALIILGLFLRHLRMTALVTLAIPMSIFITLGCLYFLGESLNLLSLMGLMLSVGMVVDNAIVVVENIARLRQKGEQPYNAAFEGTSEIALAIFMATSTTVVVFLPLILMSGSRQFRFYMSKLGYPVCIALAASLLVALLFIPLGAYKMLGKEPAKPWPLFDKMISLYRQMLSWFISRRFDAVLISLLLFMTIQYPLKNMKRTYRGQSGLTQFSLRFTFPQNFSFKAKDKYIKKVEKLLQEKQKKWGFRYYTTKLRRYSSRAKIKVYLSTGKRKIKISRRSLMKRLQPILPRAPGVVRKIGWRSLDGGNDASITMHLYGPDSFSLEQLSKRLQKHFNRYPALRQAEADLGQQDSLPEVQLKLIRRWAMRYQMPALSIGGNVSYALSSRKLRSLKLKDREIPVVLQVTSKGGMSLHKLSQLPLYSRKTIQPIPLNQVTKQGFSIGPRVINRINRKTFLKMKITTTKKDLLRLYRKLDQVMKSFPMPEGYSWDKGFQYRDMQSSDSSQQFALLLSITFVLILMGILFESLLLPFSVLLSIPLAFLGVYWTLYLTGTAMDMMAGIGLVMLVGLVVNHAIVLIDRINQLKEEGIERHQAIIDAGSQRLRPILMTTLTTIFGLLPMAFGQGDFVGISYAPLGRTVIGGLTASALLSLFIVPLFYTFFDDLRYHFKSIFQGLRPKS